MSTPSLIDEVRARLHARGERMTRPRRAVLEVLAGDRRHLSAEEIVLAVAVRDPGVHRASVYRTLGALSGLGVVQHVHLSHAGTAYHLTSGDGEHLHLQCTLCGSLADVPTDLLEGVAADLERGFGFVLDLGHVALSGRCVQCPRRPGGTAAPRMAGGHGHQFHGGLGPGGLMPR